LLPEIRTPKIQITGRALQNNALLSYTPLMKFLSEAIYFGARIYP